MLRFTGWLGIFGALSVFAGCSGSVDDSGRSTRPVHILPEGGSGGEGASDDAGGEPGAGGIANGSGDSSLGPGGAGGAVSPGGTGGTFGPGGAGGTGGGWDGGSIGSDCPRSFAVTTELTEWQPRPPPAVAPDEWLRELERAMTGTWHGIGRTPEGWTQPVYEVAITFGEGRYSAHCASTPTHCCVAFYYGTDLDDPLKAFRLLSTDPEGRAFGEIDIVFDYNDSPPGLPSWQGLLQNVEIDATGNRLRFEFKRSDGYGPVRFDLSR